MSPGDLTVHTPTGLLTGVRQVLSPHRNPRPSGLAADLVVLHGISLPPGQFGGPYIEQLFTGNLAPTGHPYFAEVAALRVSAHLLVRRDGEVVQFVPFGERAWHAGRSSWQGRPECNDYSIGIELEGTDTDAYAPAQYQALARVLAALCAAYPALSAQRLVGHSDVAPGRKSDPGDAFDWPALRRLLAGPATPPGP